MSYKVPVEAWLKVRAKPTSMELAIWQNLDIFHTSPPPPCALHLASETFAD